MKHLEDSNILYDLQHAFRSSRSCGTQLIHFVQNLAQSVNKTIQTDLVIMDFAKAFDKVSHRHLLYKLSYYCGNVRYNTHLYCLEVQAGFYSDAVECLTATQEILV